MTIEYTDRYGGHAPSWLRGCHGDCEAMGVVPSIDNDLVAWVVAHNAAGEHECDGWHFLRCEDCGGTGRVSWLVTVARIPRWLWKGACFYRFAMRSEISPPDWTWWQRFANYLNAAFVADIKALRR